MLRKLIFLGIFTGCSASIPLVYQANPEAFESLVRSAPAETEAKPIEGLRIARSEVAPATEQMLGRKVRVDADQRGHFVGAFKLNGRTTEALIDTGATLVAMNVSTARRVGISLTPGDFTHRVNTANGEVKAAPVKLARLQIGRIAVDEVDAVVLEDRALSSTLVGMSFLNRLHRFHVEGGALIMQQ